MHLVEWDVPTPWYLFEAERDAGVRTTGLLAHQVSDQLEAIKRAIEVRVRRYAKGDRFAIPMPRTLSSHRNVERQIDSLG
jgi:hypothetical protein